MEGGANIILSSGVGGLFYIEFSYDSLSGGCFLT
jgi:hypothetical protein